jgi:hypothetical protein
MTPKLTRLPPEVIQMIAMNLDFNCLYFFQRSSEAINEATSDVSFYYDYLMTRHPGGAIFVASWKFRHLPNLTKVLRRLFENMFEYPSYFC